MNKTNRYEVTYKAFIMGENGTREYVKTVHTGNGYIAAEVKYDETLQWIALDWPFGLRDAITLTLTENGKIIRQRAVTND